MSLEEEIQVLRASVDELQGSLNTAKNDLVINDWARLDMQARIRELEKKNQDNEAIGNMDKPDGESPYFDSPAGFPYGDGYAFGLSVKGSTATIYPGYVIATTKRTHYASIETDVALSGSGNMYIYAYIDKSNPSSVVVHNASVASWPESNDDYYVFPLYLMNSPDGTTYNLVEPILGGQSIVIGSPVGW